MEGKVRGRAQERYDLNRERMKLATMEGQERQIKM